MAAKKFGLRKENILAFTLKNHISLKKHEEIISVFFRKLNTVCVTAKIYKITHAREQSLII